MEAVIRVFSGRFFGQLYQYSLAENFATNHRTNESNNLCFV